MDQHRFSPLSKSSPPHRTAEPPGGLKPSESLQPTLLSLCTGLEEPNLDLTNSVDTDVTTKILPAVTHEHVQPWQEIHTEYRITREVHTHDVYHRVLPIVDTEVLPPRHFIDDGTVVKEVPAEDVWKHTLTGRPVHQQTNELKRPSHEEHASPERKRPKTVATIKKPILADKKTYITEGGYPRTEYLWLHPPVFEDVHGRTQPVRIPAGFSPEWKAILLKERRRSEQASVSPKETSQEDAVPKAKRRKSEESGRNGSPDACAGSMEGREGKAGAEI